MIGQENFLEMQTIHQPLRLEDALYAGEVIRWLKVVCCYPIVLE